MTVQMLEGAKKKDAVVQWMIRDISKRVTAENRLKQVNDELEERVEDRTHDLQTLVGAMAGREVRMAELKKVIVKLRNQIVEADMIPIADDPLKESLEKTRE